MFSRVALLSDRSRALGASRLSKSTLVDQSFNIPHPHLKYPTLLSLMLQSLMLQFLCSSSSIQSHMLQPSCSNPSCSSSSCSSPSCSRTQVEYLLGRSQRYHYGRCAVLKRPSVSTKVSLRRVQKRGKKGEK